MRRLLTKVRGWDWRKILFFAVIFVILLVNSVHNSYPDEFDNISGGYFINMGMVPYRDFFSHHGVFSYFLASFLTLIGGQSFVNFRLLSTLLFLGFFVLTYLIFKKRSKEDTNFFFIYIALLAVASTYFWGHMFLADNLSGYLIIPAYGLLFLKMFKNQVLGLKDLIIISVFSAFTTLNSTTFVYESMILTGITFFIYFSNRANWKIKKLFVFGLVFATPFLAFLFYLIITGAWTNFYNEAYLYNKNLYIYNYPRAPGSTSFNPLRYGVVIFQNFFNNYKILLASIPKIDLNSPYNITLGVTNLLFWSFLVYKRKFILAAFSILIIAFALVRNVPQESNITDYQSAVYFLLTFFNTSFLFYFLPKEIDKMAGFAAKFAFSLFLTVLSFFWFFNAIFLFGNFERLAYDRYMGTMPLIYDRPQVAPIINSVVPKNHYCWVGPWQFEEMFYLDCKLPSAYTWFLPQILKSPQMQSEVLAQYSKNKADIIVYQRGFSAFFQGPEFNNFFIDGILEKYYTRLKNINPKLHFKGSPTKDFNLDEDFNFEKSQAQDIVDKLWKSGFLEEKN